MYMTIRQYQADPHAVEEILRQDRDGFAPLIRNARGFRDYYCIADDHGVVTSVSFFESRADAERFNDRSTEWVQQHLGALLTTPLHTTTGDVRIQASWLRPNAWLGRDIVRPA